MEEWEVETGTEMVIEESLPPAITIKELRSATADDETLMRLVTMIGQHQKCGDESMLKPYKHVFSELWTTDGVLMRNDKIVIPPSLVMRAVEAAHEGHQYTTKTI